MMIPRVLGLPFSGGPSELSAEEFVQMQMDAAAADGGQVLLTQQEILERLPSSWRDASFVYIPFARKAGVSYALKGPNLIINRNSNATEVNRSLLLAQAGLNVPRIEFFQDENLEPWSEDFTQWSLGAGASASLAVITSAAGFAFTQNLLAEGRVGGAYATSDFTPDANSTYTYTAFFQGSGADFVMTSGGSVSKTTLDLGGGVFFVRVIEQTSATPTALQVGTSATSGSNYIVGIQVRKGSLPNVLPSSYIKTTGQAIKFTLPKGHLVEPQGTNLENDSCGTVGSNVGGLTRTTGGLSPTNAGNEGITVTEQTGTGEPFFFRDVAIALGDVTYSIFVKFKDGIPSTRQIKIQITTAFNYQVTITQGGSKILETGTGSSTIIHLGDGWFRILVSGVATATTFRVIVRLNDNGNNNYIGTGIDIFDYYLRQVEQLPYATSPIFTNGAAATRLVELATTPTIQKIQSGILHLKFYNNKQASQYLLSSSSNIHAVFIETNLLYVRSLTLSMAFFNNVINWGTYEGDINMVVKFNNGEVKLFLNGVTYTPFTNTFTTDSEFGFDRFGDSSINNRDSNATYEKIALLPVLLSDEQCLQLSQL